jgi:BASS family bile acid:Na+ symporter
MTSTLPSWFPLLATGTVFAVMLSLGLLLGREQFTAALQRRVVLAAIIFAVVVPVPALAVLFVTLFGLRPPVATGILLMSISPGAPIALRRVIDMGSHTRFAPALHLAIVIFAVVTVPLSVLILDAIYGATFVISPFDVGRQVLIAQLLPIGLGAAIRAFLPSLAAAIQPGLARLGNLLLLAMTLLIGYALWPLLVAIGWMPILAGLTLTAGALAVGAACAGRDRQARGPAAVAAAMRNPGLAVLIASLNQAPPSVIAAVFGYAIGAATVVTAYVTWRRRRPAAC